MLLRDPLLTTLYLLALDIDIRLVSATVLCVVERLWDKKVSEYCNTDPLPELEMSPGSMNRRAIGSWCCASVDFDPGMVSDNSP